MNLLLDNIKGCQELFKLVSKQSGGYSFFYLQLHNKCTEGVESQLSATLVPDVHISHDQSLEELSKGLRPAIFDFLLFLVLQSLPVLLFKWRLII